MEKIALDRIIKLMDEQKLSYRALESKTGIHRSTLNRYFNGINDIPAENLYKIAEALGVSIEYLRFGYEPTTRKFLFTEHEPTDTQLLEINHQLNNDGQTKLLDYAMDLVENGKYKR